MIEKESSSEKIDFTIRPINKDDRSWIRDFIREKWGTEYIVSRGKVHFPEKLPGFLAVGNDQRLGLITYNIEGQNCEIISLNSLVEKIGIGTTLIEKVKETAKDQDCQRLWLITTNDNLKAIKFWQNRGFNIAKIHKGAIETSRKLKPEIPKIGENGIPIEDEIEMEIVF